MSRLLCLTIVGLALSSAAVHAAGDAKPAGAKPSDARLAQQARMKSCNGDAKTKGLKGDERKAFMGECLKKKA